MPEAHAADSRKRSAYLCAGLSSCWRSHAFMQTRSTRCAAVSIPSTSIKAIGGLNNEFLLLPLLGFREAAAGLLWVRCDEFFHSGDYDAILPLVRLITWLDPHAENVYMTGAWHLSYNFTDAMSAPTDGTSLLAEHCSTRGSRITRTFPTSSSKRDGRTTTRSRTSWRPNATSRWRSIQAEPHERRLSLRGAAEDTAHPRAYLRKEGRIPEALAEWQAAIDRSNRCMKAKRKALDFSDKMLNSAERHNYAETLQRYHDR